MEPGRLQRSLRVVRTERADLGVENVLAAHLEFPEAAELLRERQSEIAEHMRWMFHTAKKPPPAQLLADAARLLHGRLCPRLTACMSSTGPSPDVSHWHLDGLPGLLPRWSHQELRRLERDDAPPTSNRSTRRFLSSTKTWRASTAFSARAHAGRANSPLPRGHCAGSGALHSAVPSSSRTNGRFRWTLSSAMSPIPACTPTPGSDLHGYNSESLTDAKPYPGVAALGRSDRTTHRSRHLISRRIS